MAIVDDPQRWSKPDVYLCIVAAIYAFGLVTVYIGLSAFRRYCATRLTWWQCIFLNPYILLVMSANWARYHDPVFPAVMFALLGWLAWRQSKAWAPSLRAPRANSGNDAPISPSKPR